MLKHSNETQTPRSAGPALISQANVARPGFQPIRLLNLMQQAVTRTGLDLSGLTVLTEAATGAYCVTPIIAALAKARHVYAVSRASRYGSVADARHATMSLATHAGIASRIEVIEKVPNDLDQIDIVTNSGHLRPIDRQLIDRLPQRCVIALMFEAWEFRRSDIDLPACRRRNIPIVAVNERHISVDVFSFLGPLTINMLHQSGIAVYASTLALLCDNDFSLFIARSLRSIGAKVDVFADAEDLSAGAWDAIIVALKPTEKPRVDATVAKRFAAVAPSATVAQLWGDIDREALVNEGLSLWPLQPPLPGHMGILLSAIGPEPIVCLQSGGLRAAEWVFRGDAIEPGGIAELV
jgi:hypothetical protein